MKLVAIRTKKKCVHHKFTMYIRCTLPHISPRIPPCYVLRLFSLANFYIQWHQRLFLAQTDVHGVVPLLHRLHDLLEGHRRHLLLQAVPKLQHWEDWINILYYIILYYTILYYIILYYMILYYHILYYIII